MTKTERVPPTTSPKLATKASLAEANDRGPHIAVLPSGQAVEFQLADSAMLLRTGKLPESLRVTAQLAVAHADGIEGYFQDLVQVAIMRGGDAQATIAGAIQQGVELSHHLIAEMLLTPKVTPADVAEGLFHELDVRMLLEFAERRRNLDAAGNQLPIVVLDPDSGPGFVTDPATLRALRTGERTGRSFREMFPTLTAVTCECPLCNGRAYIDEVALLVIEDAVYAFPEAVRAERQRVKDAWAEAHAATAEALAAAQKGRGGA